MGLSNMLLFEGKKYNIYCNFIVLMVVLRLIYGILFFDVMEVFKFEYVVFYVVFFCYEICLEIGGVFFIVGGWVS